MKNFILIQMQIDVDVIQNNERNISMSNVVRQIEAESKEILYQKAK